MATNSDLSAGGMIPGGVDLAGHQGRACAAVKDDIATNLARTAGLKRSGNVDRRSGTVSQSRCANLDPRASHLASGRDQGIVAACLARQGDLEKPVAGQIQCGGFARGHSDPAQRHADQSGVGHPSAQQRRKSAAADRKCAGIADLARADRAAEGQPARQKVFIGNIEA